MAANSNRNDQELNDLLDNALQDFDGVSKNTNNTSTNDKSDAAPVANGGDAPDGTNDDSEAFFLEQAKVLADRMNTLFGGQNTPSGDVPPLPQDPDQILAGFKKMAEAAALTLQGENPASDEDVAKYSDSIAQAIKGLQEGADSLNSATENDVMNMFTNMNLDGPAEGEENMFLPFMEGMMQSLLSAEILLPSIKELLDKYPKYLNDNADKLSSEDKERYQKQFELYKIIEGHLSNEKSEDSPAAKREKFKVVLDDMRRLQEYGNPPEEILAPGDLPLLDPNVGAGANPQCPMM